MIGSVLSAVWLFYGEVFSYVHPVFWVYVPYWSLIVGAFCLSPLTVLLPEYLKGRLDNPFKTLDEPDVWIVHGRKYNLRLFMKIHPGGEFVLRAGKGSDITGLVESYHVFIDREVILQMLDKYEIVDEGHRQEPLAVAVPADPFHEDLKQMVRDHFKGQPRGAHKMTYPHLALSGVVWLAMMYFTYLMLVTEAKWTIPVIGLCEWYVGANVFHDASHNAVVMNPRLNRILSFIVFPWGFNVHAWRIQHVVSHHVHTNGHEDVDLFHFSPFMTLKKGEGTIPQALHYLRVVLLCAFVYPHLTFAVPYGLLFGHVDPLHGHKMYDQFSFGDKYRRQLRGDIALEVLAIVAFLCLVFRIQGFVKGLCFYLSVNVVTSYLFSFFTQVSHLQEECFLDPLEKSKLSFMRYQASTSMDFAADSFFWGHVSGGLNTQTIHHCLPSVSAMHLRSLYPKFRQVCMRHGVQLKEATSLIAFVWGFIQVSN